MKRTITLVTILSVVLFFTSCNREESVNIDQNRIYSTYEFIYDTETNVSHLNATFRLDNSSGQKLELSYPSRVDFNGEQLDWRKTSGYYRLNRTGNLNGGTFNFFDINGVVYSIASISLSSIDIPFGMNSISKSGNFFLPWTGNPLQQGETIQVRISGSENGGSQEFILTQPGATHILLDQYKLNNLTSGTASIQIERSKSSSLTQSNLSGGRVNSTYRGRKVSILIVD